MMASQSTHAIGVPSMMQAAVSTWRVKSSVQKGAVADDQPRCGLIGVDARGCGARRGAELAGSLGFSSIVGWVPGPRAGRLGQEVACVLAGGSLGDAEHQGQVQRVGPVSASCRIRSRRMRSTLTPWGLRWKLTRQPR
jgi:hypothetical protein